MLSNLGPLFKTMFRKAESADARLEIRREEKENPGKKPDEHKEDSGADTLWDDTTEVSIAALHNFFVDFLRQNHAPVPAFTAGMTGIPLNNSGQDAAAVSQSPAARAARAYGATASHTLTPPATLPPPDKPEEDPGDLVSLLSAEEIRTIHHLIARLDRLSAGGLQTLTIVMEGSFLESVERTLKEL